MRCNWSTRANSLLQGITRHDTVSQFWRGTRASFHSQLNSSSKPTRQPSSPLFRDSDGIQRRGRPRRSAHALAKIVPTAARPDKSMTESAPSTDAQISRAAAKAVRMCMRAGEIADAYYILNSLESPPNVTPPHEMGLARYISVPHRPFIPLPFSPTISPRLAAHSLLHGLLRVGLTTKAYQLAESLMENEIKLRPRSIDTLMHALVVQGATPPGFHESRRLDRITKITTSRKVLALHPRLVADQSTRYAVRLILKSRHYRQRCTSEAYHSIIRYLLQRAEILVASLLFCTLVKDYQLRKNMAARLRGQIQSIDTDDESEQAPVDRQADLRSHFKDVLWQKGVLDTNVARSLVESIEASMLLDPQHNKSGVTLQTSLQALAFIAMLLDERRIPFPEVASIIRALYSCPKSETKVWIIQNGMTVRVEAYEYFHSVLLRLSFDLPTTKPLRRLGKSDSDDSALPPLDLASYNSLLHYALRHRHDPVLAKRILRHMQSRPKPLKPNIVTHNILIRSGTLLRKVDITEAALESLRRSNRNALHEIMVTPFAADRSVQRYARCNVTSFPQPIRHRRKFRNTPPFMENDPMLPPDPLTADGYTLTSYVMHLTATGRPHVVADVLFHVLPELSMIDHPSWGSMTHEEAMALRKSQIKSRRKHLHRAASFGPYFFAAILNALRKSGKTGLTERVWRLAKQAEQISWMAGGISPWFLPVHAYTIMLQCYSDEARKGLAMRRIRRSHASEDQQHDWQPLSKQHVRGWARFILLRRLITLDAPRHVVARWMGVQLYRSMKNGAEGVFNSLIRLKTVEGSNLSIPQPDARFFNAALKLFAHKRGRVRTYRSRWRRRLRNAQMRYARSGAIPKIWDSTVQQIAQEMMQCGFSLPVGLRPMFIGRMASRVMFQGRRRELDQRPFKFLRVRNTFRSHGLVTVKTRGLPVKRQVNK